MSNWQQDLSFSDRFGFISELAGVLQKARIAQSSEARQQARDLEARIYAEATSLADYRSNCRSATETAAASNDHDEEVGALPEDDGEADPQPAVSLGQYQDVHFHRDGLFSTVYRAVHPHASNNKQLSMLDLVALKLTTPSMMEKPHDSEREARILESLQHPNIITLVETFRIAGGRFVLVFPFLPYELQQMLQKGHLPVKQARSHLKDLFRGLEHIHAAGFIHRDIKPSNILLRSPRGPAYVTDFGITWSPEDAASEPANNKITDVGTTAYRPPELLFGHSSYDSKLDMWAAGCVVAQVASLGNVSLFEPGDLGTELALIRSIFSSIGTPNLDIWPEAANFPDWGKMQFREYAARPWSELLPNASSEVQDLVSRLVTYESGRRLSAAKALEHSYFTNGNP